MELQHRRAFYTLNYSVVRTTEIGVEARFLGRFYQIYCPIDLPHSSSIALRYRGVSYCTY
ncbi:MAG: hypothetical protein Kow00121_62090 [Elainellaceae cyanobacterium]